MRNLDIQQRSEEWFEFRKGKISGTMVSELYSPRGTRKLGFYDVIAQRLAVPPDDEPVMDRGLRLEEEAIAAFTLETGKTVHLQGVWQHSTYDSIILSPDGAIPDKKGVYTEAVEVKCLNSARHLEAVLTNKIPNEYESQATQYFIVNEDLERLYFVFYDPRVTVKQLHIIVVERDEDKAKMFFDFQVAQLKEIDEIVERLSF